MEPSRLRPNLRKEERNKSERCVWHPVFMPNSLPAHCRLRPIFVKESNRQVFFLLYILSSYMLFTKETSLDFGKGFWKADRMISGKKVDQLRNQNIPSNSKTIDRTSGLACIISHKSTDIRRKSYENSRTVYRLGMKFIQQLSKYQGEIRRDHKIGATYHLHWATDHPDCKRILEWFIPFYSIPQNHISAIEKVVEEAALQHINVNIYTVLDY